MDYIYWYKDGLIYKFTKKEIQIARKRYTTERLKNDPLDKTF